MFKAKPLPPSGNGGDGTNTYPPRPRDGLGVPRWDLFWERSCWLRGSLFLLILVGLVFVSFQVAD